MSRLFEIANQLKLEKAKLESVYERQQKAMVFNQQINQAEADERKQKEAEEQPRQQAEAERNQIVADWQSFWLKLGIKVNLAAVKIPECQPEFGRILIIPQGLTLNQAIQFCKSRFSVSSFWADLDKAIGQNDRAPTQAYAVCLRDHREADEELKNLSANALAEKKIAGITLLERLVYELKYFDETGDHLDKVNCTLCCGSRFAAAGVPGVHWHGSRLRVFWCFLDSAFGDLRARAVVLNRLFIVTSQLPSPNKARCLTRFLLACSL